MESFLRNWLSWPSIEHFLTRHAWGWPMCETLHFIGLAMLVGIVAMYDLRMLGMAKDVPLSSLKRLLPWAVFGFVLCVISGLGFVLGLGANLYGTNPYDVIRTDIWLQLKLIFLGIVGINLLAFHLTGTARMVDTLGPGDDAPPLAKVIAGVSLSLWIGIVWVGRYIPWGLGL